MSWQRGAHRMWWGADWEYHRGGLAQWLNEPVLMTLFSPDEVRRYNALPQTPPELRIPLPPAFRTLGDVLQLPLETAVVGVGDPRVPQRNGGKTRTWVVGRLYWQDIWRLDPRLTVNYGLGWSIDRYGNFDLTKPAYLAPIFGADALGPSRKPWKNFSPVLRLAWTLSRDGKTVIRAGSGIYYDFFFGPGLDGERAALGPPGLGRQDIEGSRIENPRTDVPGVPLRNPLDFRGTPTLFTGAHLMQILPVLRADLERRLGNADPSVRAIEVSKQASRNSGGCIRPTFRIPPRSTSTWVCSGRSRRTSR